MNVKANAKSLGQGARVSRSGRRASLLIVATALAAGAWTPLAHAARLAAPRVKVTNFAPEELELGATAVAVSERSEPLRLQFADAGTGRTSLLAAAEMDVSPRRGPIVTSLDAAVTVNAIQIWRFDQREKSTDELVARVDATHRSLEALASQRPTLRSDNAQEDFNSALRKAEDAEQHLRRSLQAIRSASEQDWSHARSAVSADFAMYADAVSQAEAAMAAGSTEDSGKKLG